MNDNIQNNNQHRNTGRGFKTCHFKEGVGGKIGLKIFLWNLQKQTRKQPGK